MVVRPIATGVPRPESGDWTANLQVSAWQGAAVWRKLDTVSLGTGSVAPSSPRARWSR